MSVKGLPGKIAEIKVSYSERVRYQERIQVKSSRDAHELFLSLWDMDLIEYQEQFWVAFLGRAHTVKGVKNLFTGGVSGCVVDLKLILGAALKTNSSSILIAHNHPSGNLQFSKMDLQLTQKIKEGAKLLDMTLLDHLVLTPEGYTSCADEGLL